MSRQNRAGLDGGVADAFASAIAEGLEKGIAGLRDRGSIAKLLGDSFKGAFLGGGGSVGILPSGGSGGGFGGFGGIGGIGDLFGGSSGGFNIGGALEALAGGGGKMDILGSLLGGVGGPIGLAFNAFKIFDSFTRKATNAPMAKVDPIFNDMINMRGDGLGVLLGSDMFKTAAFSSRNAKGDLFRRYASSMTAPVTTIHIKPSREFDAISEQAWVRSSKRREMGGIPSRTNFNHG